MQLAVYILRRLGYLAIALFLVSLITFVITRVLPGNPAYLIVGVQADQSTVDAVTERLGLNDPIHEQYITYLGQLADGDLGDSWRTANPVTTDIAARWPATIELASVALVLAIAWSVPLGVLAALRRKSISNRIADLMGGARSFHTGVLACPDSLARVLRHLADRAGSAGQDAWRGPRRM